MITVKQMQAFYWVGQLGSFSAAADKLNIAQSTISKRIQELETALGLTVLERDRRADRLTLKGQELLPLIEESLRLQERIRGAAESADTYSGRFRVGITELVALTWLSELVARVREFYPRIEFEPQVDSVGVLYDHLANRSIDLLIGPRIHRDEPFKIVPVAAVDQAWMCSPKSHRGEAAIPLKALERFPLLVQPSRSGLQLMLKSFLESHGVRSKTMITCNSMMALSELAAAGFGVTCLPSALFNDQVVAGRLRILKTDPAVPKLEFVAAYRDDTIGDICARIADMAREVCRDRRVGGRHARPNRRRR